MRIRSITAFIPETSEQAIQKYSSTAQVIRENLEKAGYEVQTVRAAMPSFTQWLGDDAVENIIGVEKLVNQAGFDYLSIGPVPAGNNKGLNQVAQILQNTKNTFCTCHLSSITSPINLEWLHQVGEVILNNSHTDEKGFTNLRFAGLANVKPNCPFFPAAYTDPVQPGFGIAMEAADLAIKIFEESGSPIHASKKLISAIEETSREIEKSCVSAAGELFHGIDFTLAPFPEDSRSIGAALEALGIPAYGLAGSLAASAYLMSILDQTKFRRTGFNGLMLPILEDSRLAVRNASGNISIQQLLLYSTVCGTGLDCIPLPGDVSAAQIASILLDVTALSTRLQKPLTARLMPVPGKVSGEMTEFDFGYFANSKVMDPVSSGIGGLFSRGNQIPILKIGEK